jgi:ribonuclease-3
MVDEVIESGTWIDAKSLFQEKAQENIGTTPSYKTIKETGPDHDKHFTVSVSVGTDVFGTGVGKSKQDAEQEAARNALEAKGWK